MEIPKGKGVSKVHFLKESTNSMTLNCNLWRGGRVQAKKPSKVGRGMDIFWDKTL